MSGTFCSGCGARVTPNARFCTTCGHRVSDDVPDQTGAATEITQVPNDPAAPTGVTHTSAPDAPTGITDIGGAPTGVTPTGPRPSGATAAGVYEPSGPYPTGTGPQHHDAMTQASMIPGALGSATASTGSYDVPPTPTGPNPRPPGSRNPLAAPLVILSVALLVLVVIGVATVLSRSGKSDADATPGPSSPTISQSSSAPTTQETSAPQTSESASSTTEAATATTTAPAADAEPTTDGEALTRLSSQRSSDMSSVPLDGTWVAQVASQYVGVTDPTINNGAPMSLLDIWKHHQQMRNDPRFSGRRMVLVKQDDFGKIYRKQETWITLVLLGANDRKSALQWCANAFSTDIESAKKVCVARQLDPPHS